MAADPDCLFCKIVAGGIPATRIAEDERTIAFMDINPATRGHVLAIPREHAKDLLEIDPEDLAAVARTAQRVAATMPERLGADGVNLLNSCGRAAWQTVFHFHVHVIPRYDADPLRLPWTPEPGDRDEIAAAARDLEAEGVRRLAIALLALAALPVAARAQVEAIEPTFQLDRKQDVRGPLDIVRVAMSKRLDGSLRGELTMRRAWEDEDVGDGSLCLRLYVRTDPEAQVPEYLVCATRGRDGALVGRVLRNSASGLPRTVGEVTLTRASRRTIHLGFEPSAIRSPEKLRFAGESVWRGARCPRTPGCRDLAPDAPDAREFRLRRDAASG